MFSSEEYVLTNGPVLALSLRNARSEGTTNLIGVLNALRELQLQLNFLHMRVFQFYFIDLFSPHRLANQVGLPLNMVENISFTQQILGQVPNGCPYLL